MSYTLGFLAAITSAIAWGSYFVPMKKIKKYNPFYYQVIMCSTIFLSSLLVALLFNSLTFSYWGILSGVLWASGNILSVLAVKHAGLSRAAPVWMSIGIIISFLWGTLFFHEPLSSLPLAIFGILLLIIGITMVASTSKDKQVDSFKGLILAALAGVFFGNYMVFFKISGLSPLAFLFPMSSGILIGGLIIYFSAKKPTIDLSIIIPGAMSGLIWNLANIVSFFAVIILGIAIAFPLTQMALFVSILWGLFYFREIKGKEKVTKIIVSAIILISGAILLGISK